jgi:hypothetical protein
LTSTSPPECCSRWELRAELRGSAASELHGSLDDLLALAASCSGRRSSRRDAGRGDECPVSRASPAYCRTSAASTPSTGASASSSRREGPALDRHAQLGAHLRSLRRERDLPLVDPDADVALGVLTDLEFGEWAKEAWPKLSDAVLAEKA